MTFLGCFFYLIIPSSSNSFRFWVLRSTLCVAFHFRCCVVVYEIPSSVKLTKTTLHHWFARCQNKRYHREWEWNPINGIPPSFVAEKNQTVIRKHANYHPGFGLEYSTIPLINVWKCSVFKEFGEKFNFPYTRCDE